MLPRRFPRALAGLLIAGASVSVSTRARASEPGPDALPLTVLTVQTNDADEQADSLTKALRLAVKATPGWSVADGDYSLEVITLQLKCDPNDAACASRIADQIHAERFVWGTLKKKGTTVSGDLHLWVRGKGSTAVPVSYAANLVEANDDALRKIASDAINQLTGGPPKGNVHVKYGDIDGQVFLDGTPVGALGHGDGTYLVPSGAHHLIVKAPGHADVETNVTIKPGVTVDVSLSPSTGAPSAPMDTKRVVGYATLGAGVVFALVGVISALEVNGVKNDPVYQAFQGAGDQATHTGPRYASDVCDFAKNPGTFSSFTAGDGRHDASEVVSLCSKASTFEALQLVTFPLAAIAGGVGVYLVATSGKTKSTDSAKRSWQIQPQVGLGSGKVDFKLTF